MEAKIRKVLELDVARTVVETTRSSTSSILINGDNSQEENQVDQPHRDHQLLGPQQQDIDTPTAHTLIISTSQPLDHSISSLECQ
jgi:hypothetical protein